MATTGAAWHISNPDAPKPWAWFDPQSRRAIPVDFTDYLADIESAYASHVTFSEAGITVVESVEEDGVIVCTVEATGGSPALVMGQKYSFTVRLTSTDGQVQDQTLYLRMREM